MDEAGPSHVNLPTPGEGRVGSHSISVILPSEEYSSDESPEEDDCIDFGFIDEEGNTEQSGDEDDNYVPVGSSALHVKVLRNKLDEVKSLLRSGSDVNMIDSNGNSPLLLAGTKLKAKDQACIRIYEEIVNVLVESGADVHAEGRIDSNSLLGIQLLSASPSGNTSWQSTTPLLTAASLCSLPAVQTLIEVGGNPLRRNESDWTPTHQAASSGSKDLLEAMLHPNLDYRDMLLEQINCKDINGNTPLHVAAETGSHECVKCLIKHGANLSLKDKWGISAIEAILILVPHAKSFILSILDSYVSGSKNIPPRKRGYKLDLDFSMLCPRKCRSQTDIISALFTARNLPSQRCRSILKHPLIEAYILFKWSKVSWLFLVILLANLFSVITLTSFVSLQYYYREHGGYAIAGLLRYWHLVFSLIVVPVNAGQFITRFQYCIKNFEAWTHLLNCLLSAAWTIPSILYYPGIYSRLETPHWMKDILAIQLPLSWAAVMFLFGRYPVVGNKAVLFGHVLKNAVLTMSVVGFIIIGFSFSFFIQFHGIPSGVFDNPWRSIANTLIMMTGEYGYMEIFGAEEVVEKLPIISRFIFLAFVLVATVVLMNLIIGLAVSDIQNLSDEGEWRSLKKKAESIDLLECLFPGFMHFYHIPKKVTVYVHPRPKDDSYSGYIVLSKQTIRSLVNVALREEARENTSGHGNLNEISINIPFAREGTLKHRIFSAMEVFFQEINNSLPSNTGDLGGILNLKRNNYRRFMKKSTKNKKRRKTF